MLLVPQADERSERVHDGVVLAGGRCEDQVGSVIPEHASKPPVRVATRRVRNVLKPSKPGLSKRFTMSDRRSFDRAEDFKNVSGCYPGWSRRDRDVLENGAQYRKVLDVSVA